MDFQPYLIYEDIRVLGSISKASRGVCVCVCKWLFFFLFCFVLFCFLLCFALFLLLFVFLFRILTVRQPQFWTLYPALSIEQIVCHLVVIIIIMDAFLQLFDIAPSTISVHFCLSWAISLAFSKVRFSSWSSFWTAPSHVVFGLPLGRLTFRMPSTRACFAGASSGSLNRWPIHSNLLFWIFLLHSTVFVLEYRSLFDIFFGHAIFKIFLSSDLWKMLMSSASFFLSESRARRCTKRCFLCMRWRF